MKSLCVTKNLVGPLERPRETKKSLTTFFRFGLLEPPTNQAADGHTSPARLFLQPLNQIVGKADCDVLAHLLALSHAPHHGC